nr:hypothetical protein [Pseudomonas gingeri]
MDCKRHDAVLQKGEGRRSGPSWTSEKSETVKGDLTGIAILCRSRLASDEAYEPCIAYPDAIAGKPAPTGFVSYAHSVFDTAPCRSWLASDEAYEPCIAHPDAIAGKPAPTGSSLPPIRGITCRP